MRDPLSHIPPRILDRIEQSLAALFFGWLCWRLWPASFSLDEWLPVLLLMSEGLVLIFLLIRKSTDTVSPRSIDWFVAVAGTVCSMAVIKGEAVWLAGPGGVLLLSGMFMQFAAKVSLNVSFGIVPANRGVMRTGAYRLVRHPMYMGYILSNIGYLLLFPLSWNFATYALAWTLLILRIRFEERVLRQSEDYQAFMKQTRWRLLPFVY